MSPCRRAEVAFRNLQHGAYLNVYDERTINDRRPECCGFNHDVRGWVRLTEHQIRKRVDDPYLGGAAA